MKREQGPRTVVISGASAGIGLAVARAFASLHDRIVIGARRLERLEALVPELKSLGAADVFPLKLDVCDAASVHNFAAVTLARFSGVDVLVNNSGLAIGTDPLVQGKDADWEAVLNTNVLGVLRMTRAFLPSMLEAQSGHIVNMGSIAGFQVYKGGAVYCASKHALMAISKTLRLELNGTPIRVTSIDPGMVESEFSVVRFSGDAARAKAVYQGMTPLTPSDIADCVAFAATRPAHVNIEQMILMPTDQANVSTVHRRTPQ